MKITMRPWTLGLRWLLLAAALLCASAAAVTREEVLAGAERLYRERVAELAAQHALDSDAAFVERLRRIAEGLIAQAGREHAAALAWEIHSSDDETENASCMAGGKLLVGRAFVRRLELDDAELAMLLSHEMQHALREHNLLEFEEALRLEPAWNTRPFAELEYALDHNNALMRKLAVFDAAQEAEADREGLLLAWRAGWPAPRLANYYRKLARQDPNANFDSAEHPATARRWQAMRDLAARLGDVRSEK